MELLLDLLCCFWWRTTFPWKPVGVIKYFISMFMKSISNPWLSSLNDASWEGSPGSFIKSNLFLCQAWPHMVAHHAPTHLRTHAYTERSFQILRTLFGWSKDSSFQEITFWTVLSKKMYFQESYFLRKNLIYLVGYRKITYPRIGLYLVKPGKTI